MKISNNQIFSQVENCFLEKMGDDLLLYNPANTLTLHLNEPCSVIWQLIDGETRVAELIEFLQQQFPDSRDQIEPDVIEALSELYRNQVIRLEGS